jgi:hypothetical protein
LGLRLAYAKHHNGERNQSGAHERLLQSGRILALAPPVTVVTVTGRRVRDMIQASGVANEEIEVHSLPYQ